MTNVKQLMDEHDMLDRMAVELLASVRAGQSAAQIVYLRARLSSLLGTHLAAEDRAIYPRLAQSACPEAVSCGRDFTHELAVLSVDWEAYLREWSEDSIAADFSHFAAETEDMMTRLRERIEFEQRCLLPLAVREGALPLRAAA